MTIAARMAPPIQKVRRVKGPLALVEALPADGLIDAHGLSPLKARRSCSPRISLAARDARRRDLWGLLGLRRGLSRRGGTRRRVGGSENWRSAWLARRPLELLCGQPGGVHRYARRVEEERLRFGGSEGRAARAARAPAALARRPDSRGSPGVWRPPEASADRRRLSGAPRSARPVWRMQQRPWSWPCPPRSERILTRAGCSSPSRSLARRPLRPKTRRRRAPCP